MDPGDQVGMERLHEVRLRGLVPESDDPAIGALLDAGHLIRRGAFVTLTPAGRERHAAWARLAEGSPEHHAAKAAYDRFLELDGQVKQLTTEWQLAAGARGDGYSVEDWELIDRLTAVNDKAGAILLSLGRAVPRFATYRPRLRHAVEALEGGDPQWFSGLRCDSFHTVWWQLHEDLLLAVGLSRSEDPNQ